jgi:hypothetical protein
VIDIEVDLFDELARLVLAAYPRAYVTGEVVPVPAQFPAVSIEEASNTSARSMEDSGGREMGAYLTYEVQVAHPSDQDGKLVCRRILGILSDRMEELNFDRTTMRPVKNEEAPSIYRMVARYIGVVDRNGTHYRR